jgi:hypothetical protein
VGIGSPFGGGSVSFDFDDKSLNYKDTGYTVAFPGPKFEGSVTTDKVFGEYGTKKLGNIGDLPDIVKSISKQTGLSEKRVTEILEDSLM